MESLKQSLLGPDIMQPARTRPSFAFFIVDWLALYEVNRRQTVSNSATDLAQLRNRAHKWIPLKVHGHSIGEGWTRLVELSWKPGEINELAVFGLFCKLLEIAGDQAEPALRGWILDGNGVPYDVRGIAKLLKIAEETRAAEAMDSLINLNWICRVSFRTFRKRSESFRKLRNSFSKRNENESKGNINDRMGIETESESDEIHPDIKSVNGFALMVHSAFKDSTRSDAITFNRIGMKLKEKYPNDPFIFDKAIQVIGKCRSATNQRAYFTKLVQEIFKIE